MSKANRILDYYLKEVQGVSDMQQFLQQFDKVVKINDPVQQYVGMTIFNESAKLDNIAFLFEFDTWVPVTIHTVGMKFPIDIHFFNKFGHKVSEHLNVPPGIEEIESGGPTQYAVEVRSKNE